MRGNKVNYAGLDESSDESMEEESKVARIKDEENISAKRGRNRAIKDDSEDDPMLD